MCFLAFIPEGREGGGRGGGVDKGAGLLELQCTFFGGEIMVG